MATFEKGDRVKVDYKGYELHGQTVEVTGPDFKDAKRGIDLVAVMAKDGHPVALPPDKLIHARPVRSQD